MPLLNGFATSLIERFRRFFGGRRRVQVAALPWRRTPEGVEVMLVTSRGTGRWVLPKGWPEGGEKFCEAACREAEEEAGLSGTISQDMAGRYYYQKCSKSGVERRLEVQVFPMKVEDVAAEWREKGKRKRLWVAPSEAARMVGEPDLRRLLSNFSAGR